MIAMATAIRQLDGDYAFRYNVNKTEWQKFYQKENRCVIICTKPVKSCHRFLAEKFIRENWSDEIDSIFFKKLANEVYG